MARSKKSRSKKRVSAKRRIRVVRKRPSVLATRRVVKTVVPLPEPVTDVVEERVTTTTEPEVEIRKPATLSQALTEPAEVVVKPKTRVRREVKSHVRRTA